MSFEFSQPPNATKPPITGSLFGDSKPFTSLFGANS